jgi:SAM-dependent methyltransferase
MTLSDLVQFLNYLDQYDLQEAYAKSLDPANNIARMIMNADVLDSDARTPVKHSMAQVDESLQNFSKSVQELRQKILWKIQQQEQAYFDSSTELFNTGYRNDSVNHIINRTMSLSDEAAEFFEQRLKIHTSWQHPGLIFRPVHLSAFHDIVALDPVYLVDTHEELLTSRTQQFTERYQRRVRNYIIDDYNDGALLDQLPRNQFGLVAAQNFFNFKPIEIVTQIIKEVYDLLKPGGAFVFTYNNCDLAGAVKLAERSFTCYTPGRLVKQAAAAAGYQINFEHNEINGVSILELGRPGERESLRGGQTLAVIKDSISPEEEPVFKKTKRSKAPKNIDNVSTRYYTDEERIKLQMSAVALGIDTEDRILNDYTMENLEQFVTDRLNTRDFNQEKFQKRLDKLILKRKNT